MKIFHRQNLDKQIKIAIINLQLQQLKKEIPTDTRPCYMCQVKYKPLKQIENTDLVICEQCASFLKHQNPSVHLSPVS